jgi:hypothetical protein
MIAAIFDRGRRELWFFTTLAVLLVLIRSMVFVVKGYVDFSSDQAIVGLMAKHLSEFRTFPLFYYGQNYMLGVQSWMIAPFFWVARPSIAVLKTPLVLLNIVAAVLLMRAISRRLQLRPAVGFVAALPFIMPTPVIAGSFLQTLGSSGVEPLLYVLILWMLRRRPFAFGAMLLFGFLHREFTMYAVPALLMVNAADRSVWSAAGARAATRWTARMAAGFAVVWLILYYLRFLLDGESLFQQAKMASRWVCLEGMGLVDRIRFLITTCLPVLIGGTRMPLDHYGMRSSAVAGYPIIGWIGAATMLLMLARLAWLWRFRRSEPSIGFAAYLALVGCAALAGYGLTCAHVYPIFRYFNLAILLPIGCFAAFVAREPSARLRSAVIGVFVLWGAVNLVDNVRTIRAAYVNPLRDPHGELTEFLLSRQVRYARANYWDAYVIAFLSRERVIVGSSVPMRIPDYENRVDQFSDAAVNIVRQPCEGQLRVAGWCVQLPVNRPGDGAR